MFARIERVAQPVAQKVEAQHHEEDRDARPHRHPGRLAQEVLGGVEHRAPTWRRRLLAEAGIDIERDRVTIAPVPGAVQPGVSFGVTAAQALADGKIDAFWANGMAAEIAVRQGAGKVLLDIRRGDAPKKAFNYTMPALIGTDALIERDPEAAAAAIRAIVATQNAIKADIGLATKVGEKLFPASGAAMIADVVARDLPYYDAAVSEEFVLGMNEFMTDLGWLDGPVAYDRVVATRYKTLWAG